MEGTKKPITYWFKAMWWFTTRKSGINAVDLKELLGLGSYETAWSWLQKLRRCTIRQDREKLSGRVEVDEFTIGGQRSGKRGRGADAKVIVAIAVERDDTKKQIGRVRLHVALDLPVTLWKRSFLIISKTVQLFLQINGMATMVSKIKDTSVK